MSVEHHSRSTSRTSDTARTLPPAHGAPRPGHYFWRVAVGTVVPGAGLLATRWRFLGWVMVSGALLVGSYLAVRIWEGGIFRSALEVAVQPVLLQRIAAVVMVGAVLWIGSIVLTAQQSWTGSRSATWLRVGFAAAACLVVAAPAAMAVRYLDVQASVIDEVFVAEPPSPVRPDAAGSGAVDAKAPDPWAGVSRVNTLLIGSDAGKDRWGVRTDSLMVVSTDTATGDTLLIGIPRNLENVPFPDSNPLSAYYPNGYDCGDECLMNGVWTLAEGRPDLFPDVESPGRQTTIDVVGEVTGLSIDHSVVIDLEGFRALVDAMGGVDINVQQRVCVDCHTGTSGGVVFTGDKREWIEPGLQHLDGRRALWYARSRAGSDDFSRMRRQRCVAGALMTQADPAGLLARYPRLAAVVKDNISIDIPRSELTAWVDLAERIQKGGSIRSLPITADVIRPARPDFAKIRRLVEAGLTPPAPRPAPSAAASPAVSTSGSSTPTPTASATPTPTPTPDDSEAAPLAATC